MSDELKIGDLVTWDKHGQPWRGKIIDFDTLEMGRVAVVFVFESFGEVAPILLDELTRVTPTQLVAAVAARPLDDAERESAIAGLVDDYDEVMQRWAGSLGTGVEA